MTQADSANPSGRIRILFVCSGNTCRSPMAEVLSRQVAEAIGLEQVEVRSAGTHTRSGFPASAGARKAALRHGLSLEDHSSTELTEELVDWADRVFAMGPGHLDRVERLGGAEKAVLLGDYALHLKAEGEGSDPGRPDPGKGDEGPGIHDLSVPDPFGGDDEVYEDTFQTLKHYVRSAMTRLAEELGG